jgi:cation transporter-like permease
MGGLILDFMVVRFEGIAVFQPVINGVGGNLVAVQASRISTALHRDAQLGTLTDDDTVIFITPAAGFFGKGRQFVSSVQGLLSPVILIEYLGVSVTYCVFIP